MRMTFAAMLWTEPADESGDIKCRIKESVPESLQELPQDIQNESKK